MAASDSQDLPRRIADLDGQDAYALLGLSFGAAPDEIAAAYRREMARVHPDRGGSDQRAQLVNCAFDVLSRHRDDYDELRGTRVRVVESDDLSVGSDDLSVESDGLSVESDDLSVEPDVLSVEPDAEPLDDPIAPPPMWWSMDRGVLVAVLAVLVVGIGMVLGRCDASPAADNGWSAGAVRVTSGSRTPVSTSGAVSMASATGAATVASSGTVEASIAGAATVASTAAVDPASAVVAVASALEVSGGHRCELRGDGSLWCVGRNAAGQLGDGSSRDAAVPVRVVGPVPVRWVTVSVGGMASCGLRDDGALWCWGDNSFGQLGDGTNSDRNVPVPVSAGAQWLALDVDTHVCAVRTDHTLWCWGSDRQGELGDGLQTDQATPVRVGGEASWAAVSVGPGWTCGVRQEGSRQCWGVGAPAM